MSHFTVTVLVPPIEAVDRPTLDAYLNGVLDRYDENREVDEYLDSDGVPSTCNPDSKWDWWVIGGRWLGYLVPRADADASRLLYGRPGVFGNAAEPYLDATGVERRRCDGGPLALLDLAVMRGERELRALSQWDTYARVTVNTPEPLPWSSFHDRYTGAVNVQPLSRAATSYAARNAVNRARGLPDELPYDEIPVTRRVDRTGGDGTYFTERESALAALGDARFAVEAELDLAERAVLADWDATLTYTLADARRDYGDQPRVAAVRAAPEFDLNRWGLDDPVETFEGVSRDEFGRRAALRAVPGYATVTPDGEWVAPGELGWFGVSSDDDASYELYVERVNALLDDADPATWLVVLDCHI